MKLHLDFETFSACDLRDAGLDNYARHKSTGVHCLAWAFDDNPVGIWLPGNPLPPEVEAHVESGGLVYAHNAVFEILIWNLVCAPRYGWKVGLRPEQCRCTMAMAYAMGLPGALENAAPALGINARKDMWGKRAMLKWCKPKADGTFWVPEQAPLEFKSLCDYCVQDVEVERELHSRLRELSPTEQRLWALDYHINQRGVLTDQDSVRKGIALVIQEQDRLNKEMLWVTCGAVGKCTEVARLVQWIKSQGVKIEGVAKADVLNALSGDLPLQVREALELRKEAAKSSTAKLAAMRDRACEDGRVRGIHQFHGAATGRWAGRGIQVQNLPRPRASTQPEDVEDILAHLEDRDYVDAFYGPALAALSDCVRGMIIAPPGYDLVACDFSAVEARTLAWLAGEEHVLKTFRKKEDIYKVAAAAIYHVSVDEVTKSQRQVGKVAVLALGYGGGVKAFQEMAKVYEVKIAEEEAERVKLAWRNAHSKIVGYWYALENAALEALGTDRPVAAGPVGREILYRKKGSFLWCRLPSGRAMCYPYPEIREVITPWGAPKDALTYMTEVANPKTKVLDDPNSNGKWKRISTYGGSLAENITQATARDLLRDAMFLVEDAGYPIGMHVHDEVIAVVKASRDKDAVSKIEGLMSTTPAWAKDLPLAAEGWRDRRYRK